MNILNSKWMSLACSIVNAIVAVQCYAVGAWTMCSVCLGFTVFCGYNFWNRTEEE